MRRLTLFFTILSICSCATIDLEQRKDNLEPPSEDHIYEQGEVRIRFNEEMTLEIESALEGGSLQTKSSELNSIFDKLGIKSAERVFPHAGEYEPRTRKEGLHRWYVVSFDPSMPVTKAEMDLSSVPGIEIVEPIRKIEQMVFNDLDTKLWGLYNQENPGIDINVVPVWDNYTTGSHEVIVAVVDDGIALTHEDLASNCAKEGHYNFVNDNTAIVPGDHGTHVAGTIAGVSNNGKGISGIAGGDHAAGKRGVTLLSCQIFQNTSSSSGTASGAVAIKWGADHGAVISQNSWGYQIDRNGDGTISETEREAALSAVIGGADKEAVDYFIKYAGCDNEGNQLPDSPMKGGVVIFAAGNDGFANGIPANYEPILSVGSIGKDGKKSEFSNYGPWVDVCAPGEGIYSTNAPDGYVNMSGTSMACPHVSGVAALTVSYLGGQGFTNEMLVERLKEGSNKNIVSPSDQIGGLIDALGAITYGSDAVPEAVGTISAKSRSNFIDLSWDACSSDDGKPVYGYYIFYSTDRSAVKSATVSSHENADMLIHIPSDKNGKINFCIKNLKFETKYYIKVIAYTYNMNTSKDSEIIKVSTEPNLPPVITIEGEEDIVLRSDGQVTLIVTFSEPDGHKFTISHTAGSEAEVFTDNMDGRWFLTITASKTAPGKYKSTVSATDEYGCTGTRTVDYEVLPNRPPVVLKDIENMIFKQKGEEFTLDLNEYFYDEDGEVLKYESVVSNDKVLHLHAKGTTMYGTVIGLGSTEATITAVDAKGEKCSVKFNVVVRSSDKAVDLYPIPVTDHIFVGTVEEGTAHIVIKSSTGRVMVEKNAESSLFNPAVVDMTSCPPGIYSVTVTISGKEHKSNVVKI